VEDKEIIYEYIQNGETIKTNIYYEEDLQKIRGYMHTLNHGKDNTDSAAQLLVKFFEYYAYYFDHSEQKISIHKELKDCFKKNPDLVAFSIDDPFDPHHNPGKSMLTNSAQFNKFITSMKKEINFVLNGEYVKRLEKIAGNN
jgi:DNA polymerase sigma